MGAIRNAAPGGRISLGLSRLGPRWQVVPDVAVGGDQPPISHLVIGKSGVFALNARNHPIWRRQFNPERVQIQISDDEFLVDGVPFPYLPQARTQAWRAAQALSAAAGHPVYVRPGVVVVGCEEIRWHTPPGEVEVLTRRHVVRWLNSFPPLDLPVSALSQLARDPRTWQVGPWVEGRESLHHDAGPAPKGRPGV